MLRFASAIRSACRRFVRRDFDYRRAYARLDLNNDYWSVVGPANRHEYEALSAAKLKHLIDLGLTPSSRVLDVGCGTGLLAAALEHYLDDRGAYVGADLALEAIDFCRSRFKRGNFRFLVNGMTEVPLHDEAFDVIVFYSVFTHTYLDETILLLAEARRLLANGGFVFADAFTSTAVERCEGGRDAVVVNEQRLRRLAPLAGLTSEEVLTLPGPRGSQRRFWRLAAP
jgi:ubiquinone/menaquinone biosynthesis C-methylase UbiE